MLVAIIDSGITADHPHLGSSPVVALGLDDPDAPPTEDGADRTGHGTAAAAAIVRAGPPLSLLSIRVLDNDLRTTRQLLASAIREAARRGARVINLSLGSQAEEARELLAAAVDFADERGSICVAAAHPRGATLWPADLETVLSAEADPSLPLQALVATSGPLPRFRIHSFPRPIPGRPPSQNLSGPSFAAATLSGRVAFLLAENPELDRAGVVQRLQAAAQQFAS